MTTVDSKPKGAVVVTGASTGIGRACALRLDRLGYQVFAGVRRDADGKALKKKAKSGLTPLLIDVTEKASITAAALAVDNAVGEEGLLGLVNNAGIAMPGPLEFLPLDDLRSQMEVNVIGQVAVTQSFLPLLRKGKGRIVNIGSIGGRMATKGQDAADVLLEKLPPEGHKFYDEAATAMRRAAEKTAREAIPPSAVAKAVVHALTAQKPKTRYVVGTDARIQSVVARLAPDRMKDWLVAREMGLTQSP
jgi:NAD(P)-dependent dehydrogenase (short-subunit alcohol dehydrogenase family)